MAQSEGGSEYEAKTSIPIRRDTRENLLKPLLMGGETYDALIRRMVEQYDPPKPEKPEVAQ